MGRSRGCCLRACWAGLAGEGELCVLSEPGEGFCSSSEHLGFAELLAGDGRVLGGTSVPGGDGGSLGDRPEGVLQEGVQAAQPRGPEQIAASPARRKGSL